MICSRKKFLATILALTLGCALNSATAGDERLRNRLEAQVQDHRPDTVTETVSKTIKVLHDQKQLLELYEAWGFERQWTHKDGSLNRQGKQLLERLNNALYQGLNPEDYHAETIQQIISGANGDPHGKAIDLELLLSDGLALYLKHSYQGKVTPKDIHADWTIGGRTLNRLSSVAAPVTEEKLASLLNDSEPDHPAYRRLKNYYARLLELDSDNRTSFAPFSGLLKPGAQDPRIPAVREALTRLDIGTEPEAAPELFDNNLKKALITFQQRYGLNNDGILGQRTYNMLQKAVNGDPDTIRANLERWRWLPNQIAGDYVLVNIADFNLKLFRNHEPVLSMDAIVGKPFRMTPVMSEKMRYVVIHPSWSVPYTIASKDLLPKMRNNPDYFRHTGMQVFENWGQKQQLLDPASIDWHKISPGRFPFHLRQPPGPNNPLGKVKFMFPNEHSVYLHDTNDHSLFAKGERGFSSGCVRISRPIELLRELFRDHPKVTGQKLDEILTQGKETSLTLQQPLDVYIQYWTAWVEENDQPVYRYDIYERDSRLLKALDESWQANQ